MAKLSKKDLKRIQDLMARMMDQSSDEESVSPRTALNKLLKEKGLTQHDLLKIIAEIEMERMAAEEAAAAATRAAGWKKGPDGDDLGIPGNDLLGNAQKLELHNPISGRDGVVPVRMEFVAFEI